MSDGSANIWRVRGDYSDRERHGRSGLVQRSSVALDNDCHSNDRKMCVRAFSSFKQIGIK